jgi:hypothetical protein
MKPEEVNASVAAEWPGIAARDKIAFFAADVSCENGEPVLTYTFCAANEAGTDEAWAKVRQKMQELAGAIHEAVVPDAKKAPDDREIRFLGDVQRLKVEPGDVLVAQVPGYLPNGGDYLRDALERLVPGCRAIVLDGGAKLGVLTAADHEPTGALLIDRFSGANRAID